MNIQKILLLSLGGMLTFTSCKNGNKHERSNVTTETSKTENNKSTVADDSTSQLNKTDSVAPLVANYLIDKFLKPEDKRTISEGERRFSLYRSDLNNDGKKEIFVYLNSPYFCGTGGCTVLLLSPKGELITKFTVTRPPIFIEPRFRNGWKILTVKSEGEWKELIFKAGSYPANPTILDKASYDAPSGRAEIAFDEKDSSKIYRF